MQYFQLLEGTYITIEYVGFYVLIVLVLIITRVIDVYNDKKVVKFLKAQRMSEGQLPAKVWLNVQGL